MPFDNEKSRLTVIEYKPQPVESFKCNWGIYQVMVRFSDGTEKSGTMQGDTHMWAEETFEEENELDSEITNIHFPN